MTSSTVVVGSADRHDRIRVLALASRPAAMSPSQRFRIEQWAPHLAAKHGIDIDLLPFESPELAAILHAKGHTAKKAALVLRDFLRRSRALRLAASYDVVIVHREAALPGPAVYERLLKWAGRPFIYDFDDAIWLRQESRNGLFAYLKFPAKTGAICQAATACTPGNSYLAEYARRRNPNTVLIPTSIELSDYSVLPEAAADRPFTVCWTGSTGTLAHFEHARLPLERLAAEMPLIVKVICNEAPEPVAGAEYKFVKWSPDIEVREIADSHAGIMPLPDNDFTRGKCGLKALQCMATGRPVVASPVGVNVEIINHGRNGFLAATPSEFVDSLRSLAASPALRAQLGAEARRTVEQSYSAEVVAARFAEVVRNVAGVSSRRH